MKKGKWNYTEDIEYRVILVKLLAADKPLHWQNRLVGEERQIVEVLHRKGEGEEEYRFWIDNADGSGLRKIERGGGPDSYSAHVDGFEMIRELDESEWQQWDKDKWEAERIAGDEWQKKNFPEEYKQMLSLRKMITGNFGISRKE